MMPEQLEKGTYGQCLRCKQPIAEGRLEMQPEALLCVPCASRPRQ